MNRGTLAVLALGLAAAVAVAAYYFTTKNRSRSYKASPADADVRLADTSARVASGIYYLGEMTPSAVYVVETSDGLALIDAGLEEQHDTLVDGLSRLGLEVGRLKLILITHAHGDHSSGARRLKRETGARAYVGADDAAAVRDGSSWDAIFSKFEMPDVELHATAIDGELIDGQVVSLGDTQFRVLATPGHTPGSCCFLLEREGERILFTGDTVMSLADGTGTYAATLSPRYRGDANDYLASLRRLGHEPPPHIVLPGHPRSDNVPQNPRLTPSQWKMLLERGMSELERLLERYRTDGADFLDGVAKPIVDGWYYLGDRDAQACYAFISDAGTYLFDSPLDEGASEWLSAGWRRLGVDPPPLRAMLFTRGDRRPFGGIGSVIESCGSSMASCSVFVPRDDVDAVARICPEAATVLPPAEISSLDWLGLQAFSIAGGDSPEVAYYVPGTDFAVLVSGSLPLDGDESHFALLREKLPRLDWHEPRLLASLNALRAIEPTVWLSAEPFYGRNANLYDRAWTRTLLRNIEIVERSQELRGQSFNR